MRAGWLVVLVVGCGDNVVVSPDRAQSGSRLKITWYDFDGGLSVPAAGDEVWDSELGFDCVPTRFMNGGTYCAPPSPGSAGFSDPACTKPINRDPNQPFVVETAWSCGNWVPTKLFRAGAKIQAAGAWDFNSVGECIPVADAGMFTEVGPEIPLDSLVELRTARVGKDRLVAEVLRGNDGFSFPESIYDQELSSACYISGLDNVANAVCDPGSAVAIDDKTFTDAACKSVGAWTPSGCPSELAPTVAWKSDSKCGTYYRLGSATKAFAKSGTACIATDMPTEELHTIGERIDLVDMTRGPDASVPRRVQPIYIDHGSLHFRDPFNLYDTQLETECVILTLPDGSDACVPYGYTFAHDYFLDAACTSSIKLIDSFEDPFCGKPRAPFGFVRSNKNVYRLGPVFTDPLYETSGTTCARVTMPVYTFGEMIDLATLPRVTKHRD